jgi:putative flippase GtrA
VLISSAATVVDVSVLLLCIRFGHLPNPMAAMAGVTVGSAVTFFANKYVAFRNHSPEVAPQALRFALTTLVAMWIHAGLVYVLADRAHVPVVIAKVIADVGVFSVGQLLVMRYLIFGKPEQAA